MLENRVLKASFNSGDADAIRRMYQKYKNDLLRLALALLDDEHLAEDVLNDVFVALAQSIAKTRLTGNLKSYLTTCIVNRARNAYRARQRKKTTPIEQAAEVGATSIAPDQSAVLNEQYRRLKTAMENVPYEQRETVILHLHNDMKFSEIAAMQNVSINTAKSRYRLAVEKLRAMLDSEVK